MSLSNLIILFAGLGLVFILGVRKKRIFAILMGIYLLLIGGLLVTEVYFRFIHAEALESYTLAFRNWKNRYFEVNSRGFRDQEWGDAAKKTVISVIGDEITAGWGINHPVDRFSNVLGDLLGEYYIVLNLGVGGATTRTQRDTLITAAIPTQIVIWQYSLNDIEDTLFRFGQTWSPELAQPSSIALESYFANYLFWHMNPAPLTYNQQTHHKWLYAAYDNVVYWEEYAREINALIDTVENYQARLIVVLCPDLSDPVGSIAYIDRVAETIAARGHTEILKLHDSVAAFGTDQVIISPRTPYPNPMFHRYVGEQIYTQFFTPPD